MDRHKSKSRKPNIRKGPPFMIGGSPGAPFSDGYIPGYPPIPPAVPVRTALPPSLPGMQVAIVVHDNTRTESRDISIVHLTIHYGIDVVAGVTVKRRRWNDALADALDSCVRRLRED